LRAHFFCFLGTLLFVGSRRSILSAALFKSKIFEVLEACAATQGRANGNDNNINKHVFLLPVYARIFTLRKVPNKGAVN
jgi:hypothetical protein